MVSSDGKQEDIAIAYNSQKPGRKLERGAVPGGNDYRKEEFSKLRLPDTAPGAAAQLYDLEVDAGETTNLYFKHPEIMNDLQTLLDESKQSGRSAPKRE